MKFALVFWNVHFSHFVQKYLESMFFAIKCVRFVVFSHKIKTSGILSKKIWNLLNFVSNQLFWGFDTGSLGATLSTSPHLSHISPLPSFSSCKRASTWFYEGSGPTGHLWLRTCFESVKQKNLSVCFLWSAWYTHYSIIKLTSPNQISRWKL